jgi:putative tryptophan/tyrosine transport system substrate-binding protein
MRRREFIILIGGMALTGSTVAYVQAAIPVAGLLSSRSLDDSERATIEDGVREFGYVAGRSVEIEYRSADSDFNRLPSLATELVRRPVSVLLAVGGAPSAEAAKAATTTIPIVFTNGSDPVKLGLVASLNRPGGNITGVTFLASTLGAKRIQLLHEAVPNAIAIGILVNPFNPNAKAEMADIQAAARALGLRVYFENVSTDAEMEDAVLRLDQRPVQALTCVADSFFAAKGELLVALAAHYHLPAILPDRALIPVGALMTYGSVRNDALRLAAGYAARILKGEKPADLPVQQATKVELLINLKTARTLGITIPLSLLGRADEVIE